MPTVPSTRSPSPLERHLRPVSQSEPSIYEILSRIFRRKQKGGARWKPEKAEVNQGKSDWASLQFYSFKSGTATQTALQINALKQAEVDEVAQLFLYMFPNISHNIRKYCEKCERSGDVTDSHGHGEWRRSRCLRNWKLETLIYSRSGSCWIIKVWNETPGCTEPFKSIQTPWTFSTFLTFNGEDFQWYTNSKPSSYICRIGSEKNKL